MRGAPALAAAVALAALGACNKTLDYAGGPNAPPTPTSSEPDLQPGERPARGSDEAGIWLHMDRAENAQKSAGTLVRDPALVAYVREIACRLAGPYCPDIRVYVVRSAAFNAAMAPNGMMLVNTGFLVRTRNEAQLATVLGHEIGHYVRRHGVQAMRDARDLSGFAAVFGLVPYGVGLVVQIAAAGSFYAFSRDHEREADSIGMRLLDKAGYDPFEVPKIWEYLEREDKARTETEERSAFSATHPPQAERKEMLEQRAKATIEANPGPRTTGADRFHEIMLPRRGEYIRDILRIAQYGRAEIMIDALIEDGVNVAELRYFKGEVYRLRAKKGDREKAIAAYREALAEPDCPPEANRALGQVLLAAGDKAEASVAFRTYLEAKPNAPDREMVLLLMR